MDQSTLNQLTMSLKDYNPTAYKLMETVSGSMEKVAVLLLLLFMGLNLLNWNQQLKSNGGELTLQLWIEEILKYAIALFLILYVDEMFDGLSWIFNAIIKLIAKSGINPYKANTPDFKGLNFASKLMLQFVYWVVDFIGQISTLALLYALYLQRHCQDCRGLLHDGEPTFYLFWILQALHRSGASGTDFSDCDSALSSHCDQ